MLFTQRDVIVPKDGLVCYTNRYWACVDGDPTKALFYVTSPQCNQNKAICERMIANNLYKGLNVSAVLIELAFVPRRD